MARSMMVLGVACVLGAGCAEQLSRQDIAIEEQAVRERVMEWSRAVANRSTAELAPFYHQVPALTVAWRTGARTHGWDEEQALQRQYFQTVARANIAVQDLTVEIHTGSLAVTTFRHSSDVILTSTERDIYSGQATMVWMKDPEDGLWKIHTAQVSQNPPDDM